MMMHGKMEKTEKTPEPIDVEAYDHGVLVDAKDPVYEIVPDDDRVYAEDLQLQEIIMQSTQPTSTNNKDGEPSCSRSRSLCGICSGTGCTHSVSIERLRGADQIFRVAITGDFDGEALMKLVNAIYDAAHRPAGEKGKEKLQFGESASLPIAVEEEEEATEFHCGICMESRPIAERFGVENCSHIFCAGCVGRYVAAKVEESVIYIRCPEPECRDGVLEPEPCRRIIPREVFDRWGLALCEAAVGDKKFYCPYNDCSVLLIDDGEGGDAGAITDAECPHCHRMFCAQCRVPWHGGVACEEFRSLGEDERGREDLMLRRLAADARWQRCPQCKMFVEKTGGCILMSCRCGYCFCYTCASPMSTASHYCSKCKR
ncbi:probable E3 ubiquitin-protein ligase RNF144A-B isoform X2 [Ananas comosus]|uniref:RBR-type E3 ubiquitin transferase n=1 Tax=Ananas comosus TaxID=4615 RepID=A0A6P5GWH5_ANACO|nr:probable E3 ubiquitin-protein ligase RNF144A-B isoform X2 [Ananas comosus]